MPKTYKIFQRQTNTLFTACSCIIITTTVMKPYLESLNRRKDCSKLMPYLTALLDRLVIHDFGVAVVIFGEGDIAQVKDGRNHAPDGLLLFC